MSGLQWFLDLSPFVCATYSNSILSGSLGHFRSEIKGKGAFCCGGRLDRASNAWVKKAYLDANLDRVPHDKIVKKVLTALVDRHSL